MQESWMKKSARVSEKLIRPGLPGLQVATLLVVGQKDGKSPKKLVSRVLGEYDSWPLTW